MYLYKQPNRSYKIYQRLVYHQGETIQLQQIQMLQALIDLEKEYGATQNKIRKAHFFINYTMAAREWQQATNYPVASVF